MAAPEHKVEGSKEVGKLRRSRHASVDEVRRPAIRPPRLVVDNGMPSFAGQLSDNDLRRLQAYIVARARLLMR